MNRILEILALALGGTSLFALCFLGFASMAGVPMHDVAVLGKLFPEPAEHGEEGEHATLVEGTGQAVHEEPEFASDSQVIEASIGVLGAFSLAPPFSAEELKSLADKLKLKRTQLDVRLKDLEARSQELDGREEMLAEQFQALEELRGRLEAFEQELSVRAEEVSRAEAVASQEEERKWKKLAELLEGLDPEEAGKRITAYSPVEATQILRHFEEDLALQILNTLSGDKYLEYSEAWAGMAAGERP